MKTSRARTSHTAGHPPMVLTDGVLRSQESTRTANVAIHHMRGQEHVKASLIALPCRNVRVCTRITNDVEAAWAERRTREWSCTPPVTRVERDQRATNLKIVPS